MKVIALIPAAGMGKRMGAAINKQYLLLNEKPIVAHTITVFENAPFVDDIYVIVPEAEIPIVASMWWSAMALPRCAA